MFGVTKCHFQDLVMNLDLPFPFFGELCHRLVISNHGVVSFGDDRQTQCPTNCFLYSEKSPMIAILLVPNENTADGGIYYRKTKDPKVLEKANKGTRGRSNNIVQKTQHQCINFLN
jgi:hypothetical protein